MDIVELDETMSQRFVGKQAIIRRIDTRLKHTKDDIPYYERGVNINEFVYGNPVAAIKLAFKDFGPQLSYDSRNSRIQYYDVNIDIKSDYEEDVWHS